MIQSQWLISNSFWRQKSSRAFVLQICTFICFTWLMFISILLRALIIIRWHLQHSISFISVINCKPGRDDWSADRLCLGWGPVLPASTCKYYMESCQTGRHFQPKHDFYVFQGKKGYQFAKNILSTIYLLIYVNHKSLSY